MAELINQIRFYHYISGVLTHQQGDPLCSICKAYANTGLALREALARLSSEQGDEPGHLSAEAALLLEDAQKRIAAVHLPENAAGQKKAGRCKMPSGVCFIKISRAIIEKIKLGDPLSGAHQD